jgi:hypothetical protein
LAHPRPGRVRRHTEDVHPAGSITNGTYRRLSSIVSRWKQSAARMPRPARTGTVATSVPRGVAPARCRPGPAAATPCSARP